MFKKNELQYISVEKPAENNKIYVIKIDDQVSMDDAVRLSKDYAEMIKNGVLVLSGGAKLDNVMQEIEIDRGKTNEMYIYK